MGLVVGANDSAKAYAQLPVALSVGDNAELARRPSIPNLPGMPNPGLPGVSNFDRDNFDGLRDRTRDRDDDNFDRIHDRIEDRDDDDRDGLRNRTRGRR